MFKLESSSYVLEIPNVVYTILSQNLIGGSTVRQNRIQLQVDCMILEKYNEKAPLNINMPYLLRCVPYLRLWLGLPVKYQCPCRPTGFRVNNTCLDCTAPMLEKSDKLYADCLYVMAFNS